MNIEVFSLWSLRIFEFRLLTWNYWFIMVQMFEYVNIFSKIFLFGVPYQNIDSVKRKKNTYDYLLYKKKIRYRPNKKWKNQIKTLILPKSAHYYSVVLKKSCALPTWRVIRSELQRMYSKTKFKCVKSLYRKSL